MAQILPGTYVDVVAGERTTASAVTGVVSMPYEMDWGDKITVINKGDSTAVSLGYDISNPKVKCVNEVMNYATKLILYRSNISTGVKATATLASGITATAKYVGLRGNDLSVTVSGSTGAWTIKTYLAAVEKDSQIVATSADFVANDWITITGTGTLAAITVSLTSGANGAIQTATVDDYITEMQKYEFNVIAYLGESSNTRTKLQAFVNDQRNKDNMIQMVMNGVAADNKAIYNSTTPGITENYNLTALEACSTLAGIVTKQGVTGSLTHFNNIIGWTDVGTKLTYEQQQAAVTAGQLIVVMLYGIPTVLYDINSLTTFTDTNPKDFRKGLVVRTLDKYVIDLKKLLDTRAIGKIRRSTNGKNQIKGMIADMTSTNYLLPGYIENFTADDVTITDGADGDEIIITVGIQVVDTVDKIYVTVTAL
jgi:Phage tail sheath protein.